MRSIGGLDPRDRIGQLLWIGFDGTRCTTDLLRMIRQVRPGGFILFARNIRGPRQVRSLIEAITRPLSIPPFVALDQEGGRVNRLRGILGPSPAAHELADMSDADTAVRRHASATALALGSLGFNVNFTPVLDLSDPGSENGIGDRAYGIDPTRVAELARITIVEHLKRGILPVGKHFPGLGAAGADTHLSLPVIRRSRSQMWTSDLLPYRRLRTLLPMVMVGHACYPSLQGRATGPASLSPRIMRDLLRRRIGFRGLILTDDLEMGAVDQGRDAGRVARICVGAGADGVMFCRSVERILCAHDSLMRTLEAGGDAAKGMRTALQRVLRIKERHLSRRRARFSTEGIRRARSIVRSLGGRAAAGFDPTARA